VDADAVVDVVLEGDPPLAERILGVAVRHGGLAGDLHVGRRPPGGVRILAAHDELRDGRLLVGRADGDLVGLEGAAFVEDPHPEHRLVDEDGPGALGDPDLAAGAEDGVLAVVVHVHDGALHAVEGLELPGDHLERVALLDLVELDVLFVGALLEQFLADPHAGLGDLGPLGVAEGAAERGGDLRAGFAPLAGGHQLLQFGPEGLRGRRGEADGDGRGSGNLPGLDLGFMLGRFGDDGRLDLRDGRGGRSSCDRGRRGGGGRRGLRLVAEEGEVADRRREREGDQERGQLGRFADVGCGEHDSPLSILLRGSMTQNRSMSRRNHNL
jgi:hypothetical protein